MRYWVACFLLVGCASKHEVKNVETKLESQHGSTSEGTVGLNKKGEAVIQSKTTFAEELTIQEHVNEKLQAELDNARHMLKLCRRDLADPRLGGTGQITAIPAVDQLKVPANSSEELGKDEKGNLVVIRRTMYLDKLEAERQFEKALRNVLKVVSEHKEDCEQKMAVARTKHGLPAQRYSAEGRFDGGRWVEVRKAENTLDDAFDILNAQRARNAEN